MTPTQFPPSAISYPLSFHTIPDSFALFRKSSPLESSKSTLFLQNTRGGGTVPPQLPTFPTFKPTNVPALFARPFVFITIRIALPANAFFSQRSALPGGVGVNRFGNVAFGGVRASG